MNRGGAGMTGAVNPTRTRFSAVLVGVAFAVNWNSDPICPSLDRWESH